MDKFNFFACKVSNNKSITDIVVVPKIWIYLSKSEKINRRSLATTFFSTNQDKVRPPKIDDCNNAAFFNPITDKILKIKVLQGFGIN